jgi:hypothetical protein
MRIRVLQLLSLATILLCTVGAKAQGLEIGVKAGGAFYSGDLSPQDFGVYFEDVNFAGGAYLRYRPANRFGVRFNGNFGNISAENETVLSTGIGENQSPVTRSFKSKISEFNAVLEYDLFYVGDYDYNFAAFYLYGGIGVLSFNPQQEVDGEFVDLQPLRTEGQGLDPTNPNYAATPYELTKAVGVFGGGVRVRFAGRIVVGLEIGTRFTGTDYLDDTGFTSVRYLDVIGGPGGTQAGQISNPAVTNIGEVSPDFSYRRGGEFNDYYFVGGLTVGITIGEGGGKKTGCYNF